MFRSILLPTIFIILGYGFYISPDFKEISAGVSIFLFGMISLEEGFKAFSGGMLEKILKKFTNRRWKSLLFGAVSTTLMQSSSLVSILTISFLSVGLIGLAEGIGVIFGANIGTTTGAWLVAGFGLKVKISAYAMPMLVFGVILIFQKSKSLKGVGYILTGLGFLFLGIHHMKEGFEAFKAAIDLSEFGMTGLKGLFTFTLIGIFATVVMQSSHATLVLIITALAAGQISYENALALAIGANVGTTITAIMGAMSSNIAGKRLAGAHFIFNIVTGLIAIIFMQQIMISVDYTSNFVGIASDDYTLKLAVFHTIFNVIGVIVMVPFIGTLVIFLEKFEGKKKESEVIDTAKYLNDFALEMGSTTILAIARETKHLYENVFEVISHGLNLKRGNITSSMDLKKVILEGYKEEPIDIDNYYELKIKGVYGEIVDFSARAQSNMSEEDIHKLYKYKLVNRDLVEAVKETRNIQKNMIKYFKSSNKSIVLEYIKIKRNLAELLRFVDIIANSKEEDEIVLCMSKIELNVEKYDIISNGKLDALIRGGHIDKEMATSLMNDSSYAYNIGKKLISMAETLFLDENSEFILTDDEVTELIKNDDTLADEDEVIEVKKQKGEEDGN